jgi:transcriptional regulator with XRE-family HTH domain
VKMESKLETGDSQEWGALGKRLKDVREYLAFSQQYVSEQTGIPRTAIGEIERGTRRVNSLELQKLAKLYRHPINYFLDEDPGALAADHAVAGLARRLNQLRKEDLDQVLKFATFLEMSHRADNPDEEVTNQSTSGGRGAAS